MDEDKINELVHYMKGVEPFSEIFSYFTKNYKKWCAFRHGKKINYTCYRTNAGLNCFLKWLEKYVICCNFLDVDRYTVNEMSDILTKLKNPEIIVYCKDFKSRLDRSKVCIDFIEKDIKRKLENFTCQECQRLDEAIVCFLNHCFYSCVTMAVSAVETRIHEMIRKYRKSLYLSYFKKATLGQIIQVFDTYKYTDKKFKKIKELLPPKHKPLVALLNQYRVFSVHPKEETITAQIAESILHLSFCFMMDSDVCPYSKKTLKCK
jgi:hypothetical protein